MTTLATSGSRMKSCAENKEYEKLEEIMKDMTDLLSEEMTHLWVEACVSKATSKQC